MVVFFSVSKSKLIPYVLPVPRGRRALSALSLTPRHHKTMLRALIGMAALFLGLIVLQPSLARRRSLHDLVVSQADAGAKWIIAYKTFCKVCPSRRAIRSWWPVIRVSWRPTISCVPIYFGRRSTFGMFGIPTRKSWPFLGRKNGRRFRTTKSGASFS